VIRNCICGLKRDPSPGKDPQFQVVTGLRQNEKGEAEVTALPMWACRGCGVTYIKLEPANKVVLAG
jgi:hypothetical protein